MTTPLIDRVQGQIVTPEGVRDLPAHIMDADTAAIVRNYFYWAISQQLEPELFCASCWDGTRESKASYDINETHIVIVCGCRQLFFQGSWTKPVAIAGSLTLRAEHDGPADVVLSEDAARLLRLYKKVLLALGLKEALHCNACFELKMSDRCDAQVLDSTIHIDCRCSNRRYHGMTL